MVHPVPESARAAREAVTYPHPSLEPVLKRTLGVPLFQEQLLRIAMVVADFTGGEAEELRRAMGFKRSEARMQAIEVRLREGMARNGITGAAADAIILAISSFALYGFPESHAASFALIVYASAYLKVYFPSAFYAALLNNQPMGFYHPATLVKDAQRRGVRFRPIDVQASQWDCVVEDDGAIRIGLRYVDGLRAEVGQRICAPGPASAGTARFGAAAAVLRCPKCGSDDERMIEREQGADTWFCNLCAHPFQVAAACRAEAGLPADSRGQRGGRFASIEHLVAATGIREDELTTLASIGALNAFGYDRREALWQVARAIRPAGALFDETRRRARAARRPSPGRCRCRVPRVGRRRRPCRRRRAAPTSRRRSAALARAAGPGGARAAAAADAARARRRRLRRHRPDDRPAPDDLPARRDGAARRAAGHRSAEGAGRAGGSASPARSSRGSGRARPRASSS